MTTLLKEKHPSLYTKGGTLLRKEALRQAFEDILNSYLGKWKCPPLTLKVTRCDPYKNYIIAVTLSLEGVTVLNVVDFKDLEYVRLTDPVRIFIYNLLADLIHNVVMSDT
jgi:hypothetical protein